MSEIFSIIFTVTQSAENGILYDTAVWPVFVFGGLVIAGIGAVIVVLIIIAVKYLRRLANKNKGKNA